MSTDRDDDDDGREETGVRPFRCGACQQVFRTCHDPSLVHCPTCGSGDVRPVADEE